MVCTTLGRVVQSVQSGGHQVEGSMDMDYKLLREAVSGPEEEVTGADWVNRTCIALQRERSDTNQHNDTIMVVIVGQSVQGSMTWEIHSI